MFIEQVYKKLEGKIKFKKNEVRKVFISFEPALWLVSVFRPLSWLARGAMELTSSWKLFSVLLIWNILFSCANSWSMKILLWRFSKNINRAIMSSKMDSYLLQKIILEATMIRSDIYLSKLGCKTILRKIQPFETPWSFLDDHFSLRSFDWKYTIR